MKKNNIIIVTSIAIIGLISLFILITGRAITDVYLIMKYLLMVKQ